MALKLLAYVKDEVERASYEEKVAKKLGVELAVLREKGERLDAELEQASRKRHLKKPKTEVAEQDGLMKLENSLLALKIYGGITRTKIPIDVPEDETRLDELEMIFNKEHEGIDEPDYEKEAAEMMKRYDLETRKQRIAELNESLLGLDEESDEYEAILREITNLQKT